MSLADNTAYVQDNLDNAGVKLEMISALEDRWRQINAMEMEEFKSASDKTTEYGKYTVAESFGVLGKYNSSTGKCDAGTPEDEEKACRAVTLTVTGPEGVLPLGPVTATRIASASGGHYLKEPDMDKGVLLGSGPWWTATMPFDGLIMAGAGACCAHNYVYLNGSVFLSCFDYTSYSNGCYNQIYAKKGDTVRGSVSQIDHPGSPSSSWAYAYPYRK